MAPLPRQTLLAAFLALSASSANCATALSPDIGRFSIEDICEAAQVGCRVELNGAHDRDMRYESGIAPSSGTIKNSVKELLKAHPGYRAVFTRGLISIHPVIPDKTLSRTLDRVDFNDEPVVSAISTIARKGNIKIGAESVEGVRRSFGPGVTLHLKNVTIRQALNAVVRADGYSVWDFFPIPQSDLFHLEVRSVRSQSTQGATKRGR